MLSTRLLLVALALAASSCTEDSRESSPPAIPRDAVAVDDSRLATDSLLTVADLSPDDKLFQLPSEGGVFVRVRDGEPPLLFGTACDVVSAMPLPEGWNGVCLEYTSAGQRVFGEFPHGTVSS